MTHELDADVLAYYARGGEARRLVSGARGHLERLRVQELLERHLPPPPARILDVGGAAGVHAGWLAGLGHDVCLIDPVSRHLDEARAAAAAAARPFGVVAGDARALPEPDASADVVLLLGPLYHLLEATERARCWEEAVRVLRGGGLVAAVGISRFASLLDGLRQWSILEPAFRDVVARALADGHHRNPDGRPDAFTTAYLHHPDELAAEAAAAGLEVLALYSVEGPGWLLTDLDERWPDPAVQAAVLEGARALESEPALRGLGPHLLLVARSRAGARPVAGTALSEPAAGASGPDRP